MDPAPGASAPSQSAALTGRESWSVPWVQLKYFTYHPCVYPSMIRGVSPGILAGQWVSVYDRDGRLFGHGLFNPRARVPLRMYDHQDAAVGDDSLMALINRAVDFRLNHLKVQDHTDAFRAIHSDGDGLSGLVVDRFGEVLSIEVHCLGIYQRLAGWLDHLHQRLGTKKAVIEVDPRVSRIEGIAGVRKAQAGIRSVRIREHGIRYEVDFAQGHKTGFFCDQRENRKRFGALVRGERVLDLCCYTGGFALAAKIIGGVEDVTGVDLDETAVALARRNANLNQVRISWIHVDAFSFARQMQRNNERWGAVALDPPKLILSRDDADDGVRKYEDLNQLAMSLVSPGGMLVTCSCSGLLSEEDFDQILVRSAHRMHRRLQVFDRTGPGPDHPVMSNCPEGRYLKVRWARVL
jgi:23S rRNA (cytosine1962-C5)-methyltransferase